MFHYSQLDVKRWLRVWLDWSNTILEGRAMVQVVSRRPLTAETRVRARVNPCGICGGQSGHWDRFLSEFVGFPRAVSFHRRSPNSYRVGNA
jgi:hypothetical protein